MAKPNADQPTLAEASGLKTRPPEAGPSIAGVKAGIAQTVRTQEDVQKAVAARTKLTGTFRLTERLYRAGRLYEPGELVSIVDEVPGKSWVPFDPSAPAAPPAATNLSEPSKGSLAEQDL